MLSPQSYKEPKDLAREKASELVAWLNTAALPWVGGGGFQQNYRLYYQIVLGSLKLQPAFEKLLEKYADNNPNSFPTNGKAALAVIIVDRFGKLVDSSSISISSFGWGVMTALNGKLDDLSKWPSVETELVEIVTKVLSQADGEPLTVAHIQAAYHALITKLGLPTEWLEPPTFAIKSYVYYKNQEPPETLLLNSFYLNDLALAQKLITENRAPQNLLRYLGIKRPDVCGDLLKDKSLLAKAVSPGLTPLSRWPAPGRHPLVLLQQAAVNLAFDETKSGGLLGVNGPPGTGKTTLLRDIVAGVVTARAEAMAKFDDPEKAFTHSGQKINVGGGAWLHFYQLDPTLRGFETVVASSNNKAVENVSAELPALTAIASDASELRYFKTFSDALHQTETWGAIAAVLGKAQNCYNFKQGFWWNNDTGLQTYLRAICQGIVEDIFVLDPTTGQQIKRPPLIISTEDPPLTPNEVRSRWEKARSRFLEALKKSRQAQAWLESLYRDMTQLPLLAQAEVAAQNAYAKAIEDEPRLKAEAVTSAQAGDEARQKLQLTTKAIEIHQTNKPGFWARLFRTGTARAWAIKQTELSSRYHDADSLHLEAEANRKNCEASYQSIQQIIKDTKSAWAAAQEAHQQAQARIAEAKQQYGIQFTDNSFFALDHNERHKQTPWFRADVQRVRDEVFIAAMDLHRAFIDAAAKPLRHNLGVLMNYFMTQTLPDPAQQALLPDLWSSLFLVVPLVSTTFASVNRMLGKLPCESLGWLLIDEAGQALPQAAVGAIMRSRRAIVVGDPMQIEPIVSLPKTLTHAICNEFKVKAECYAAPMSSVQTLADSASTYSSEFENQFGSRKIGVPLLVHRRCAEPMFMISNNIAYSGLMVFATPTRQSIIREIRGPSAWGHVTGGGQDKWCEDEGKVALQVLQDLAEKKVTPVPDLYLLSPFVKVANELRTMVRASGVLRNWMTAQEEEKWLYERIGTVHTAQGREAEAVILVLGAPEPAQTGARNWAGEQPNLLNVAVTRAKEALYVIGNRELWREAGVFQELDKRLP
ncbi:MAG: ATP-binding protein [Acidobacteria bacterium]|nr:ATP-binding protein [Acidobacteriota bacterium]